jgi:PIN domain nuclease of toxin-antitoxin system
MNRCGGTNDYSGLDRHSIKTSVGKLAASAHEVLAGIEPAGFSLLPITGEHAARVAQLPPLHRDPFDRMWVAQASVEPMLLLTNDALLRGCGHQPICGPTGHRSAQPTSSVIPASIFAILPRGAHSNGNCTAGARSSPPANTLARCHHCWHYESMAIQINIRDVPERVRDELAARAALQGKSMQEFLRAELERLAARPSIDAWLQQVRTRKRATQTRVSAKQILENRNADRR